MNVKPNKSTSGAVVTAVATTSPDIESQQKQQQQQQQPPGAVVGNPPTYAGNPDAGKGLGIVMFVLLIVSFITTLFLVPLITLICLVATIIIASILTCGCCCARDYSLQPKVKKFASATLVSVVLHVVMQIISIILGLALLTIDSQRSESSQSALETFFVVVVALNLALNVLAIIFSALFTWYR